MKASVSARPMGIDGCWRAVSSRLLTPDRVRIDTQIWTCEHRLVAPRVKRTYNLSESTVRRVREMAEEYGVAASQDAVVELAVDELERHLREAEEAAAWERAAADPEFAVEVDDLAAAYRTADRETWPA